MNNKDLIHYLKISKNDLRKELQGSCTHSGKDSWLFVPDQPHNKICLVAHIDTVFGAEGPSKEVIAKDGNEGILTSPQGLGADDRAGVYGVLELFRTLPAELQPYVLLTDLEETGGHGAREAVRIFGDVLRSPDITYFIEIDRKGREDAVYYCQEPGDFRAYVETFGFKETLGAFSDVAIIGKAVNKCTVNVSTGYYDAHTKHEYLIISELLKTVSRVQEMIKDNAQNPKVWANRPAARIAMHRPSVPAA